MPCKQSPIPFALPSGTVTLPLTWLAVKWRAGLIRGPQERRAVCIHASRPVRAENDEFRSVRGGGVEAGGPGQVYVCAVRSQPRKMNH